MEHVKSSLPSSWAPSVSARDLDCPWCCAISATSLLVHLANCFNYVHYTAQAHTQGSAHLFLYLGVKFAPIVAHPWFSTSVS